MLIHVFVAMQAFVEYQQQKMTTDFVEQFGFNEDEFAEQEECIGWVAYRSQWQLAVVRLIAVGCWAVTARYLRRTWYWFTVCVSPAANVTYGSAVQQPLYRVLEAL